MASMEELVAAFNKADALAQQGDQQAADDARYFVQQIDAMRASGQQPPPPPTSPQPIQQPAAAPPQGGTFAEPLYQGLTLGFSDEIAGGLGAGFNSVAGLFGGGTGESFGDAYRGIRDASRYRNEAFKERNPGTALAAEIGGGLLTGGVGAATAGALRGGQALGKLAGVGAAQGATYGAGASEADNIGGVAQDAAVGGLLGGATAAAGPAIGRAAKKAGGKLLGLTPLDDLTKKNIRILEQGGLKLSAGERTGSSAIQQLESTLGDIPISGAPLAKGAANRRQQFQSRVLKLAGFADDDVAEGVVTPEGFSRARERFAERYTDTLADTQVRLGDDFNSALDDVNKTFTSRLGGGRNRKFTGIIEDVRERAADGELTGEAYQKLRSEIGKFERTAEPDTAALYSEVKSKLDDAFLNAAGAVKARAIKSLNNEYAAFKTLEKLDKNTAGGAGGLASGNIPIGMLARAAQKGPGSKEFKEFTRAGQAILTDKVPNSGTAQRLLTGGTLGTLATGTAFNPAAAGLAAGGLLTGRGAAGLLANPKAVGRAANSIGQGVQQGGLLAAPLVGGASAQAPQPISSPNDPRLGLLTQ